MMSKKTTRSGMPPAMAKMSAPALPDDGVSIPNPKARALRPGGMKKGGAVKHNDAAMDRKLIREEIGKAHTKMGMKSGGSVKKMACGGMMKGKK